jgi:TRAP-type C4-dicarboxylate transport system permease small subunit
MAGRKTAGVLQMAAAIFGAILAVGGFVWFFSNWINNAAQPGWSGPEANLAWYGLGILALAWFWSLADSISLVRATQPPEC